MSLIRGIDEASAARVRMLKGLVTTIVDLGIQCIAQGIETVGERDMCRDLGFDFGQGYLFGRPVNAQRWLHRLDGSPDVSVFPERQPLVALRSSHIDAHWPSALAWER